MWMVVVGDNNQKKKRQGVSREDTLKGSNSQKVARKREIQREVLFCIFSIFLVERSITQHLMLEKTKNQA
jgi:hypothetical protein